MSTPAIHCPGCGMYVDETKYVEHIKSNHELHKIEIKGAGTVLVANSSPKVPIFIDIPYLGRLRRDGFLAWSFIMLILGILLAGYYWRII